MKIIRISKGVGKGERTIYAPNEQEMKVYKAMLPALERNMVSKDYSNSQHGFRSQRSSLTNAMQHIGYHFTLSMDLKDFFDSVDMNRFGTNPGAFLMVGDAVDVCFPDGFAHQGLPTSPLIANIAAAPMDSEIVALSGRHGRFNNEFVYTRYADDLTFSFDEDRLAPWLQREVTEIARRHGFTVNERKTKLQSARAGRRIITGIAVDNERAYPTRYMKRRLRAACHQKNKPQARGLAEWLHLRMPKGYVAPGVTRPGTPTAQPTQQRATPRQPRTPNPHIEITTNRKFDL